MKKCNKCLIEKELNEFRKDVKAAKDGYRNFCKDCNKKDAQNLCECGAVKNRYSATYVFCMGIIINEKAQGNKYKTKKGYIYIKNDSHPNANYKGYVAEHRLVMEASFKSHRYLTKEEIVHHKNGHRDDNRIENLELCLKFQPPGQRVSDILNWCEDFIEKYDEERVSI